jgi:hypothetical protein
VRIQNIVYDEQSGIEQNVRALSTWHVQWLAQWRTLGKQLVTGESSAEFCLQQAAILQEARVFTNLDPT